MAKQIYAFLSKMLSGFVGALLILSLCFALNGNFAMATQPANAQSILTVNFNKDHSGGDYANTRGGNLRGCLKTCSEQTNCRAYTFNPSGIQNDGNPVCWLKDEISPISPVSPSQGAVTGLVLGR